VKSECQKNWQQFEICVVINDKSQGSIAKNLSWDGLLHYKLIIQFACERMFLNRRTFGEVTGKMVAYVVCLLVYYRLTDRNCH